MKRIKLQTISPPKRHTIVPQHSSVIYGKALMSNTDSDVRNTAAKRLLERGGRGAVNAIAQGGQSFLLAKARASKSRGPQLKSQTLYTKSGKKVRVALSGSKPKKKSSGSYVRNVIGF